MSIREQALDAYYDAMRNIKQPADDSCKAMAVYTGAIIKAVEGLYEAAYSNGFTDALNLNVNEA